MYILDMYVFLRGVRLLYSVTIYSTAAAPLKKEYTRIKKLKFIFELFAVIPISFPSPNIPQFLYIILTAMVTEQICNGKEHMS
jgi:hypothetical protein